MSTTQMAMLAKRAMRQTTTIKNSHTPFVMIPLGMWHEIEDLLVEISSPILKNTITAGRRAYREGRTIPYEQLRTELGLSS